MGDEARIRGLALHTVKGALLLWKQGTLRADHRDGVDHGFRLVLPLAGDRLHCENATEVRDASRRSTSGLHHEDIGAIRDPNVDALGN